jgi:hypothetical protein
VIGVNENHRRALSSGLWVIERHLHNIINKLENKEPASLFRSKVNDLDRATVTRILSIAKSMLHEIKNVKEKAELTTKEESVKMEIYAALIDISIILEDMRPEKLDAYGRISDGEKDLLRLHFKELQRMTKDMLFAFKKPPDL